MGAKDGGATDIREGHFAHSSVNRPRSSHERKSMAAASAAALPAPPCSCWCVGPPATRGPPMAWMSSRLLAPGTVLRNRRRERTSVVKLPLHFGDAGAIGQPLLSLDAAGPAGSNSSPACTCTAAPSAAGRCPGASAPHAVPRPQPAPLGARLQARRGGRCWPACVAVPPGRAQRPWVGGAWCDTRACRRAGSVGS